MRFRSLLVGIAVLTLSLVNIPNGSAFNLGSYCVQITNSSDNRWIEPEAGSYRAFNFSFVNKCQSTIQELSLEISEDLSGGNYSKWKTMSDGSKLQNVQPGQAGVIQIILRYEIFISAKNKLFLRLIETERSAGSTTNNISIAGISFSKVSTVSTPKSDTNNSKKVSTTQNSSKSKNKKCSKSELNQYEKAKFQFVLSNTQIQRANDIKNIVEEARQKKSSLLGYFVDYTQKDLYTLKKQDATIDEYKAHRDEWTPTLEKLAKKCGMSVPSRSEFLESYYEE
jgi:hypothetical protein